MSQLNFNEEVTKIFYLTIWVQENIVSKTSYFISTSILFSCYSLSLEIHDYLKMTEDGFSKSIDKILRMFSYKFFKKRLNGKRGYIGIDLKKTNKENIYVK